MNARLPFALVVLAACGTDPISYSAPVGIELKAKSGDTNQGAVTEQKDITTESGNPFGAFTADATAKLGGHPPSSIEIEQLTLTLGGTSTGVSALEQVLSGDVDTAFLVNDSNNTYDAGHVTAPMGVGPVSLTPTFVWSNVSVADQTRLLAGSFKVVLRGQAAPTFSTLDASASLQTTFTFSAFQ